MNLRIILFYVILACPVASANTYGYPEGKRPEIDLKEACGIAEKLLLKLQLKGYYVLEASLLGDEKQTGKGCWNLSLGNSDGSSLQIGVYFPEDSCVVSGVSKDPKLAQVEYTREGEISKKWLEWKTKMEREQKESDKFWDSVSPPK